MGLDNEKFAITLRQNAERGSQHKCAKYIRIALQDGGGNTKGHPVDAKDWGPTLLRMGFHEITVNDADNFQFMKGDIVVMFGSPILSNVIFGLVTATAQIGPNMPSTVIKAFLLSTALSCLNCVAAANQPNVLREPVLGLRYEPSIVKFESLPDAAIANCDTLQDSENRRAVWYIYAHTTDASSRTYYIIGGYEIMAHVPPGRSKFDTDGLGVTLFTEGGQCTMIDTARQVFDDRLFDTEMPQQTLRALARDLADRLLRAYGSAEQLRRELRNQHIDQEALPPELKESLERFQAPRN